jgi:hypothetical protein
MLLPRYPIYIPSKGRFMLKGTPHCLTRDKVPFFLVVEAPEAEAYANAFPAATLLVLPFENKGLYYARNWIKAHSVAQGDVRHWQLDDNMRCFYHRYQGRRVPCQAGLALRICEDFTDRYTNVAISGLNYSSFCRSFNTCPPYWHNVHVYSCTLSLNATPLYWRLAYNDDTDYCLQALTQGWCTILLNAFLVEKRHTMKTKGGNTHDLYQDDGRLVMARSLERLWPGLVETKRRFHRPQHVVKDQWRVFDTPLQRKPGVTNDTLPPIEDYGMVLRQVKPIKSKVVRDLYATYQGAKEEAWPDPRS